MTEPSEAAGLSQFPLGRRGLVMSGLISGFTLATVRAEAQAIHTDATGLDVGEVMVPTARGPLPAYYARPSGAGPFPIVLVIEEIFGVHEYIKDICRRLARLGYMAVATEYYARIGDLSKLTDTNRIMSEVIRKDPDTTLMADIDATAAWAAGNKGDPARLGITGFCWGGRTTWLYAEHNPNLKAAVSWYGFVKGNTSDLQPATAFDGADQLKCPLLGLYGAADPGNKVADVEATASKARAAGKIVEIVVYLDAPHGFFADYRPSYRAEPAADGWKRMLAWFRRNGVG
jgi:carboxymethylenebutenolidase